MPLKKELPDYPYNFFGDDIVFPPKKWVDYVNGPSISRYKSFFFVLEHNLVHKIPVDQILSDNPEVVAWSEKYKLMDRKSKTVLTQNGFMLSWAFRDLHVRQVELSGSALHTGKQVPKDRKKKNKSRDLNEWERNLSQEELDCITMLYDQHVFCRGCFGAKPKRTPTASSSLLPEGAYYDLEEDMFTRVCQWAAAGLCVVLELREASRLRQGFTHQWVPKSFITRVACSRRYNIVKGNRGTANE